jgi:hypothetical protein
MEKYFPIKWSVPALIAMLILAFAFCSGCSGSSVTSDAIETLPPATTIPQTPDTVQTLPPTTTIPITPEVTAPPTTEPVPDESSPVSVVVHGIERTDTIGLKYPLDGYIFLIVDFTVENSGDEAFQYHGGLVELENEEGNSYPILADVTFCPGMEKDNPFYPVLIESGKSERGKVVFGVPVEDTIVQFNLKDHNGDVIASDAVNTS